MYETIGVKLKDMGKICYFNVNSIEIQQGDKCIVETEEGLAFGEAVTAIKIVTQDEGKPAQNVLRKANPADFAQLAKNDKKLLNAKEVCLNKIKSRELPIKLVRVYYTFDGKKAIFYFTAEGRVDFRELVKDLAHILKVRIELRQIGTRDEVKMCGGLGPCGREVCCASFLSEFEPVTIKMAKEQNLILNPAKTSGLCGRLMCCLMYEHSYYHEVMKNYPKIGSKITTFSGVGKVIDINIFLKKIVVEYDDGKRVIHSFKEICELINKNGNKDVDTDSENSDEENKAGK